MEDLRIGVIGAGGRGGLTGESHKPGDGSRLVAGCDLDDDVLLKFKEKYGEDTFVTKDYKKLLERDDIDAVFICTPDFLHEEQAIDALKAGKAVYLEKPMAITIEGCDRILQTAYETKSKLYLGHNMRHFPVVLKMKELIENDVIGDVQTVWCRHFINYGCDAYFKDWHSEQKYATSLLLQKGAHDIDVIHWLAGGFTKQVVGMGKLSVYNQVKDRRAEDEPGDASWSDANWPPLAQKKLSPKIDVEDNSMIFMNLDNGVQCSYMQCHYTPDACRNYTFIGTKGRIENIGDHGKCTINVYTTRDSNYNCPDQVINLKPIAGGHGGGDPRIVEEFIRFCKEGGKTNTSPIAARNSVATGVKGAESLREGCMPKQIPDLDPKLIKYFENGQA